MLLNSDTIVSSGWLDCYRCCFSSDKRIGLATAVSNNAVNLSLQIPAGFNIHSFLRLFALVLLACLILISPLR